jgi:excinuclease ABC subunit A
MLLPIARLRRFFDRMAEAQRASDATELIAASATDTGAGGTFGIEKPGAPSAEAQALRLLLDEICTRLQYLCDVGIGYLTLDRQSRTLSGGEVQRINLTTALGTSLVNTLFVLDEPSIGLHPRDMDRITQAMLRLRDAGNTLVVVEHDPAVMLAADRVLDFGPGPGERGGHIVFDGTPDALRSADTLTGQYLGGRKRIALGVPRAVGDATPRLILEGASEHNLQHLNIEFPLQRLVCVTGVSGSGKSTLVQDVLAPALLRHFGKATETPGRHDRLLGADHLSDVVFVDQTPIGKTARSNPVSYVGAWDSLRELFAATPQAAQRGYTQAKFSFNSGDGRCPTCGGSGFEHVEMQFLSDVYLRCPDCDGKRYRPEILEITLERGGRALSVADVLELTVSEAMACFAQDRDVLRALRPIAEVGLDYVKLGQPVPTLSGGEAQRLKLAGFLAEAARTQSKSRQPLARKGTLFLFDEPTTGLHFDDIAKLMRAFVRLLEAGHSLIVIEHNLDVIGAADWIIDLGPEGGDAGGQLVAEGSPQDLRAHPQSHTGAALRAYDGAIGASEALPVLLNQERIAQSARALGACRTWGVESENWPQRGQFLPDLQPHSGAMGQKDGEKWTAAANLQPTIPKSDRLLEAKNTIEIVNAREHNLKGLSVEVPRGQFNVITGVSGSGKSTLAFDILFNEGQRRYLESLNAYARSIVQPAGRPEVDAVYGIPPTVAIEQRLSRGGRKSTVGTTTEVWHFLRLLYVKLGVQHCTQDGAAVQPQTPERIAAQLLTEFRGQHIGLLAPLVVARKGVYTELADWARPRGFTHLRVDGDFLPTSGFPRIDRFKEHTIELPVLSLDVTPENEAALREGLAQALTHGKGVVHVLSHLDGLREALAAGAPTAGIGRLQVFSAKRACPVCSTSYAELDPRLFSYNSKHGWCPGCVGTGVKLTKEQRKVFDDSVLADDQKGREQTFAEPEVEDLQDTACPSCQGTRLNAMARAVRFGANAATGHAGWSITDIARLSVSDIRAWVDTVALAGREAEIARDLIPEIRSRLEFLEEVGLGYLTLDRGAPTLSGGEAQRIRLAAQLGSNLQGVCYVLDEPTIGLHARDNQILLRALRQLSSKGNTLVVVEHDEDTIRAADHLIDIGPSAGKRGGRLVAQGGVADLTGTEDSQTGRYLLHAMRHPLQARRPVLPPLSPSGRGAGGEGVVAGGAAPDHPLSPALSREGRGSACAVDPSAAALLGLPPLSPSGRGAGGEGAVAGGAVPDHPLSPTLSREGRGGEAAGAPAPSSVESEGMAVQLAHRARRAAAQPAKRDRARAAAAAGGGHGRERLGQVHAGARRAAHQRGRLGAAAQYQGRARRHGRGQCARAHRLHRPAGLRDHRPRARSGPDAHRQDAALLPGHLHRLLGHRAQAVRRNAGGQGARLRGRALQLQHRRGPLPRVRRAGRAHHRHGLPARREGALRGLPRRALQPRDAGRHLARQEHWRRAADGGGRGRGLLRQHAQHRASAATAQGRGPGLPHAGPAQPHAQRRRGAAHQARDRAHQGARRSRAPRPEGAAHALRARRAHRGPAHVRRAQAHPRAAPPGGWRAQRGRHRARPRRHRRGRLDHRPRPRGRRGRRPHRRRRPARGGGAPGHAHRRGAGAGAGAGVGWLSCQVPAKNLR